MKKFLKAILAVSALVVVIWTLAGYMESRRSLWHKLKNPETVQKLKQFVALKEAQANADTNGVPPELRAIFSEAEHGDWLAVSNSMDEIRRWNQFWQHGWEDGWRSHGLKLEVKSWICSLLAHNGRPESLSPPYARGVSATAACDLEMAFDVFWNTDEKFSERFGREIITSIPPGSIYLGGSDAGLSIPTVMLTTSGNTNSFYILPLWIFRVLDTEEFRHLRELYGREIHLPTKGDMDRCFQDYINRTIFSPTNKIPDDPINGMTGLAIQRLMEANPAREFYLVQESTVSALLPQMEPHGFVLRLHRQLMETISDEVLRDDSEFWTKEIRPLIGDWLTDKTSLAEITTFVKGISGQAAPVGFTGDATFIHNAGAQALFSHARCDIANIYAWRAERAKDEAERKRMASAADFAFRQAWTLCPSSSEVIHGYVYFLLWQNRFAEALQLIEMAVRFPQYRDDYYMTNLPTKVNEAWTNHLSAPIN